MYILENIEIEGLWGHRNFTIPCHSDVNFFIGVNGSGKTTLVNLVAAALKLDYFNLVRVNFKRLDLTFRDPKDNSIGFMKVGKVLPENSRYSILEYEVKIGLAGTLEKFSLDEREVVLPKHATMRARRERERMLTDLTIFEDFRNLLNVSWLSIHRAELTDTRYEEVSFESTVDKKLAQLNNDLIRYFSSLTSLANAQTERFQKQVFLTLLVEPSKGLFHSAIVGNHTPVREALEAILASLDLLSEGIYEDLSKLFKSIDRANNSIAKKGGFSDEDIAALFSADQINRVIPLWNELVREKTDIYKTRDVFLEVLNGLLIKKQIRISDENVLEAVTADERVLKLTDLSSGEKQLVIILGEALINQRGPWIYIADEPELSLHVSWQEQLIGSLLKVNPNAQLIFATHSPDIVSVYQNRVFDMEQISR